MDAAAASDAQERTLANIQAHGVTDELAIEPLPEPTDAQVDAFKEQDVRRLASLSPALEADYLHFYPYQRFLPIANVGRIMKKCLPTSTKISKDAKECVQECTSEFISFITSEAAERCLMEKRKTLNGEDILFAMTTLGFENYAEALTIYLTKYREYQRTTGKRVGKKVQPPGGKGKKQAVEVEDDEVIPEGEEGFSDEEDEGGFEEDEY